MRDEPALIEAIKAIHEAIRAEVVATCARASADELAAVTGKQAGDVIYAVDRAVGAGAGRALRRASPLEWPCLLVAEGLGADGRRMLPEGTAESAAEIVALVDPIDGTRGLMYQKRSAWILTGIAPYRGGGETLADIRVAVQTEIPLVKQHLTDTLWAVAGEGARAERFDLLAGTRAPLALRPSQATTVAHGFGGLAKFFRARAPSWPTSTTRSCAACSAKAATTATRWCSTTNTCRPRVSSTSWRSATIAGRRTCARSCSRPAAPPAARRSSAPIPTTCRAS